MQRVLTRKGRGGWRGQNIFTYLNPEIDASQNMTVEVIADYDFTEDEERRGDEIK